MGAVLCNHLVDEVGDPPALGWRPGPASAPGHGRRRRGLRGGAQPLHQHRHKDLGERYGSGHALTLVGDERTQERIGIRLRRGGFPCARLGLLELSPLNPVRLGFPALEPQEADAPIDAADLDPRPLKSEEFFVQCAQRWGTGQPPEQTVLGYLSARRLEGHVHCLDLRARPRILPQEGQARLDARVEEEAADGHLAAHLLPAMMLHEFGQQPFEGHAVKGIV